MNPKRDENLLVGIETSDDAAVYKISDDTALVQTADFITPIINDPFMYGQVAASNSISDVYAMGGRPITVLNLCCFPSKGVDLDTLGLILQGGLATTEEAGALLVGGHTVKDDELKYGLSVTGLVHPDKVTPNTGARAGDKLILTKPIGTGVHISGGKRGVLAPEKLKAAGKVMATLNKTAAETMVEFGVKGCTDITGFALGGHGMEMAAGSNVGMRIHLDEIPRFPDTVELFGMGVMTGVTRENAKLVEGKVQFADGISEIEQNFLYDPQTSGGLLIAVRESDADGLLKKLLERGVEESRIIGECFEADKPHIEVVR